MTTSRQLNLPVAPLQKVSGSFAEKAKPAETARTIVKWDDIPETAFDSARLQRKVVAAEMGKSKSWLSRALRGLEKLGWCDLAVINDKKFWTEVVVMILEYHGIEPPGASAQDLEDMRIGRAYREAHQLVQRSLNTASR